jgi:hypothetical protein
MIFCDKSLVPKKTLFAALHGAFAQTRPSGGSTCQTDSIMPDESTISAVRELRNLRAADLLRRQLLELLSSSQ